MRVLFLSFPYSSARGGGEQYTEQTVTGLLSSGRSVTLISSSRALLARFRQRGWSALPLWGGIEPVSAASAAVFPFTVPFFLPLLLVGLLWFRCLRGAKAVVCLSLTDKLLATLPAKCLGMRVVWMEHLVAGRSLLQNPFRRFYVGLSRLAQLVTVSKAAADALVAVGVPRANILVIPPGVSALKDAMPQKNGHPVIGAISRLHAEKNVALLVRAFALVSNEVPEATLDIYGEGPEKDDLARLAETMGLGTKITFRGYVEDAGSNCGVFDILAVPSSRESFGLAALEAMRCGVPVVATRVGGLPELVIDGETGILVAPEDDRALADGLLTLLRNRALATQMGEAGRTRAALLFNEQKMQNAWNALFS